MTRFQVGAKEIDQPKWLERARDTILIASSMVARILACTSVGSVKQRCGGQHVFVLERVATWLTRQRFGGLPLLTRT